MVVSWLPLVWVKPQTSNISSGWYSVVVGRWLMMGNPKEVWMLGVDGAD